MIKAVTKMIYCIFIINIITQSVTVIEVILCLQYACSNDVCVCVYKITAHTHNLLTARR